MPSLPFDPMQPGDTWVNLGVMYVDPVLNPYTGTDPQGEYFVADWYQWVLND